MDFFEQPRYKINKFLLSMIGQWPNQKKTTGRFFFVVTIILSVTLMTVQIRKIIVERHHGLIIMESVAPFLVHVGCVIKVINCMCNERNIRQLLKRIEEDCVLTQGEEKSILKQYADDGRKFTLTYAVWLYGSTVVFLLYTFVPKIITSTGFANITATAQFAIPVDYFVDSDEYYPYIQVHLSISIFYMITIIVSVDVMFVVFIQHACGVFSKLGHALEHLIEREDLHVDLHPPRMQDQTFWRTVYYIKMHKEAIQFADLLDATYTWSFLFLVGFNMIAMSFTGLQVFFRSSEPDEAIRQALLSMAELLHLFFESFFSQRLTDHSNMIFESLKKTKFYMTSIRTRKLLNFMLLRSTIPCELKAGKIYTMSMENFSAVVRTSMSYFTLLTSIS